MEFRLLGPLEVRRDDGAAIPLGGAKQRALLVVLLLHPNEVVSVDRLVDDLWGDQLPARPQHAIQVFVSRLRAALGSDRERLARQPPGYRLEVRDDELDAQRCERLHAQARAALAAGEAEQAAALLRQAGALWHGPPLAEFTYEPFAQPAIARLEDLRVACLEERIETELALGRHGEVLSDLEALVREQPLRERPHGLLMIALYRSGRQADALDAFQKARRVLVDGLGIEPSAPLRELAQQILEQDARLGASWQAPVAPSAPAAPAPPPPTPARTTRQRKRITLLAIVADPAGEADPERAAGLADALEQGARPAIERHGGRIHVRDRASEVVAVFGIPRVREDDALRALRTADELRAQRPALRVGVETGEMLVEASEGRPVLIGESLDRAVALARRAAAGEVLVGEATQQLTRGAARCDRRSDGAWRLRDLVPGAPAVSRRLDTRMVDRHEELAIAHAEFERAQRTGMARLLTVSGDAGIGKSRLALELDARLRDTATILTGRCLAYGEGIAFWPLREALGEHLGDSSPAALRAALGDADDADTVAEVVSAALGLGSHSSALEHLPWAFQRLLEVLASDRPLVLMVEDSHWAAPQLLELLDYLVDWLRAPVLLLCLARPELFETRPEWRGGRPNVRSVPLDALGEEDALLLLENQLGAASLRAAERAEVLDTAGGNPLFVEQLLAARADDPSWDFEQGIPGTVEALLAARLDLLEPGERAILECAAVIGREFGWGAIEALLPDPARSDLHTLVHRGLIEPHRGALQSDDLRFHHILIRDVSYRGTPKAQRRLLHEGFARWLADSEDDVDEFVGYHLEKAYRYSEELGAADPALAGDAAERLRSAGQKAFARGDMDAAARLLERAVGLLGAGDPQRAEFLLDLGVTLREGGDLDEAEEIFESALHAASSDGLELRIRIEQSRLRLMTDPHVDVDEMHAVAQEAIEAFAAEDDDEGLARAWNQLAHVHWARGQFGKTKEVLETALVHAESSGDQRERLDILRRLARVAVIGPIPVDEGIARCREIMARDEYDVILTAVCETMLAVLRAMRGEINIARELYGSSKRRLRDLGSKVNLAALQMYCGLVELTAGDPAAAERELREGYDALEQMHERGRLSTTAALLARACYDQGRLEDAERFTAVSEETAIPEDLVSRALWRGTRAKVLARRGELAAAEKLARSAAELAGQSDFIALRAEVLSDLAEVLMQMRRGEEAQALLEKARGLYRQKGDISPRASAPGRPATDALVTHRN